MPDTKNSNPDNPDSQEPDPQEPDSKKPGRQKVAIVTGSGQGIGRAIAERLVASGVAVALNDIDPERLARSERELSEAGGRVMSVPADVSDEDQVAAMMSAVHSEWRNVDILVNNAGIVRDQLLFRMPVDDWLAVLTVNLTSAFLCIKAVQKYMVENKWGRIVNVSSVSSRGNRGQANYSAAKSGIEGLTATAALELGPYGVTVNAVAPGFIESEMTRTLAERLGMDWETYAAGASERIALRRAGTPQEVANVVTFLASEEASYVSGQTITIAGGPWRG